MIDFEFPFFLEKKAPVTGAVGLIDYVARFNATMENGRMDFVVTTIVPVTTLCPWLQGDQRPGCAQTAGMSRSPSAAASRLGSRT